MKSFMKLVIVSVSVSVSVSLFASAVFAQLPPTISCGDYRVAQGNSCGQPGAVVYNHAGYPTNTRIGGGNNAIQALANQAILIPAGGQIPQGYCTWSDRLQNVGLSTLLGGIFGALVGDNGRAAGQGAAAGLLVGTVVPCAAQQQYLQQQVVQQPSGERYQGGNTVRMPASCVVGGKDFGDVSEATCLKIRESLTTRQTSQQASYVKTYGTVPTVVGGHTCVVQNQQGEIIADFLDQTKNPKGIKVSSGSECQKERNFLASTYAQR